MKELAMQQSKKPLTTLNRGILKNGAYLLIVTVEERRATAFIARVENFESASQRVCLRPVARNGAGGNFELRTLDDLGITSDSTGTTIPYRVTYSLASVEVAKAVEFIDRYDRSRPELLISALNAAGFVAETRN